jgi:hypothetical protein
MAGMENDIAPLLDRIRALADEPSGASRDRLLAEMEHTLTDGYAHTLHLEAESLRIERQIGEAVTGGLGQASSGGDMGELAGRRRSIERDVRSLRSLLERLKLRAERLRDSPPGAGASHEAGPDRIDGGLDPVLDL